MKFEFSPYAAIQVKDYENTKDFYEKVLGMDVVSSPGRKLTSNPAQ